MKGAGTAPFLSQLRRLGVQVFAEGESLRCRAPEGVLTGDLRKQIAERKSEVLAFLRAANGRPVFAPSPESWGLPFSLTDVQQAYLVGRSEAFELGNVATHAYVEVDVRGVSVGRLEAAWGRLIARHGMLRAVIHEDGAQQILGTVPEYRIPVVDLRGLAPVEAKERLAAIRSEMSHQVFPTGGWPLFDLRVALLEDGAARLYFSIDVLIADSWSILRLVREWAQLYQEPEYVFAPLEISFRDCVEYERAMRRTAEYEGSRRYWLERLDTLPPAPDLPLADHPGAIKRPRFERRRFELAEERWREFERRARRAGVTPSGALLAAFAEVLAKWSKTAKFTLNLTLFNRPPFHPQVNEVVGDFTSLTLLAADHTARESFAARAVRLQKQLWLDLDHLHVGGVQVLREQARRQGGSLRAAMPVVFTSALALGSFDRSEFDLLRRGEVIYSLSQTSQVWLDHQVVEQDGRLAITWDSVDELFPTGMLDDMFASYSAFLEGLAAPGSSWEEHAGPALPAWQTATRAAANATCRPLSEALLHELFAAQAHRRRDHPAVLTSRRHMTYGELQAAAAGVARTLRAAGAARNTLVAVVMEKGWEQVAACLGILMAGAAYLPVDPAQPAERIRTLLEQGECVLALTQGEHEPRVEWPRGIRRIAVEKAAACASPEDWLDSAQTSEDLAYVIFTSGSTGTPKGVMIDHRGAVNTILDVNRRLGIGERDVVLGVSSLSFDLSVYDIFGTLAAGGTLVLPDAEAGHDPAHWQALMREHGVTVWNSVPALMQMLVDDAGVRNSAAPSPLRVAMLSGDWIPLPLPDRIRQVFSEARVISLGGATEASIWSIFFPVEEVEPVWKSIPYGKPLANQTWHVLNERLETCPVWTPGNLYIGGAGLAKGYWRDAEKTAASFIRHPDTGERLYRTGDLGRYLPDGNIEFLGRQDSQVKVNGYRIELGEVEAVIQRHPGVREAVVAAVETEAGHRRLAAYVVAGEDEAGLYRTESADRAGAEARWGNLTRAVHRCSVESLPRAEELAHMTAFHETAECLSLAAICATLRQLGVFARAGETHMAQSVLERARVRPLYEKLISQWLRALWRNGLLERGAGDAYTSRSPLAAEVDGVLWTQVERAARLAGWGDEARWYLRRSIEHHVPMLRGEADALELFFPQGDFETAEAVYRRNPLARYFNRLVSEAVSAAAGPSLRVLEAGAGTGATTTAVLPRLPAEDTVYYFTDVSSFFLNQARSRFRDFPFVRYGLFDIDRDPLAQGFEAHSFDVILGANVLHDARHLGTALGYLRRLLVPGGLLMLLEATRNTLLQLATVRFIEGFSHFEDRRLETNEPLLSVEAWREELTAAGFEACAAFPAEGFPDAVTGQSVILARGPLSVRRFDRAGLREFLEARLPEYMRPSYYLPLEAIPLSGNGKLDRRALPAPLRTESGAARESVAPRTPLERQLAEVWRQVLNLAAAPGAHDNFFAIGGDSLLASQVMTRLRQALRLELPLRWLFERPTVAELAERIETHQAAQAIAAPAGGLGEGEEEGEF
ncbi:MAG TPA: amino acid adenylation domain-containing protein [Bryobacteraceae bacterium]|nr:amino acid adenylation domain-containing protein [Bryobacteraceae bacterium]